jgi:hypothetical protein
MYPEDRVLVGVMPDPHDLEVAQSQHWYRVPVKHAPAGIHAEYVAFYFTSKFPVDLRWAIHFYARRTGHEMVRRVDLLPDQPDHPRAHEVYYKLQLGPIRQKDPPVISFRWRRITFIQTTWERFVTAHEINDLFHGDACVDRIYRILREQGIPVERSVEVREGNQNYTVDMLIPCVKGKAWVSANSDHPEKAVLLTGNDMDDLETVHAAIRLHGGPLMSPDHR